MSLDVETFDFTNNRPVTNSYSNMKELNIPVLVKYFENIIDNAKKPNLEFKSSELFSSFLDFAKTNNYKLEQFNLTWWSGQLNIYSEYGVTKKKFQQ